MAVMRERNLRFAAVMIGFAGIVLLTVREDVLGPFLAPLTTWTAQATRAVLHVLGMEATRTGTVIAHPEGFAYDISTRCTGVVPVAFLAAAILASPGAMRRKVIGLAVGVPVLIALNLTRLVHLFSLGVYHPEAFDLAHGVLWEGFFILAVFGLWFLFTRWSDARFRLTSPWCLRAAYDSSSIEMKASSRSVSVRIPTRRSSYTTGRPLILWRRISRAASMMESPGPTVMTSVVMTSKTGRS